MRATRREVLAAGAVLGGGCLSARSESPVSVLAAGSLQTAADEGLRAATDAPIAVEAYGSRRAAQLVAEGQRDPDILALADARLFDSVLDASWYASFASNALVVACDPSSPGGERVAAAEDWYRPLLDGAVSLGRTDPSLDPLGYRTLLALELAEEHYGVDDLRERVLGPEQVYPETQLLAQFETGGVDAAVVYRNMAVERDYPYREIPPALNLSDPALAGTYATASVTLDDGTTISGAPIEYGARLRSSSARAARVFETLVESTESYLSEYGFVLRPTHPTYEGNVPARVAN